MNNKLPFTSSSFLMAAFIFISMQCFSQDTIVKRDGRQILGKVLEVSLTEVKYKKAELADGPVYIEDKATIVKIKYQGGYTDLFPEIIIPTDFSRESIRKEKYSDYKPVTEKYPSLIKAGSSYIYNNANLIHEPEMQDILLTIKDPEVTKQIKNAKLSKGLRYVGFLAIPLGIGALVYGNDDLLFVHSDNNTVYGLAAAGGLMLGASIYFNINHKYRNAKAVRLYQQNYMMKK